jgi:hypothetical protein
MAGQWQVAAGFESPGQVLELYPSEEYRCWLGHRPGQKLVIPVATVVGAAGVLMGAASAGGAASTAAFPYRYHSSPVVYSSLWVPSPDADHSDLPHLPEPDATYYSPYAGGGTARTDIARGPAGSASWDPWLWTRGPGD